MDREETGYRMFDRNNENARERLLTGVSAIAVLSLGWSSIVAAQDAGSDTEPAVREAVSVKCVVLIKSNVVITFSNPIF